MTAGYTHIKTLWHGLINAPIPIKNSKAQMVMANSRV